MPILAVFAAAAQVRHGIHAAHLHPDQVGDGKPGGETDVESAIAVKQRRIFSVQLQCFPVREEHRHARAVLAGIKHLARLVIGRVESDFGFAKNRVRARFHVGAENRSRHSEAGEGVKRFGVGPFAGETSGRADAGQGNLAHELACEIEDLDLAAGVREVHRNKLVVDSRDVRKRFGGLGNDFLPVFPVWFGDVDGDDPGTRRLEVGPEPEDRPVVVDERVIRVEVHQKFHHRRVGRLQILVEHAVLRVRALRGGNHQITAVVGHTAVEIPILVIGPMINEFVLGLQCAEAMIIEFVEEIGLGQPGLFGRFVVARVKKSLAIFGPGRAGKLHPPDDVRRVRGRSHVAHVNLLPVRAGGGKRVGHEIAVLRDVITFQRHRAVGGKFVRIEQQRRLGVERRHCVKHVLVLQPVVLRIEVTPALFERRAVTLVIPQFGQPFLNGQAFWNPFQVTESDLVLGLNPGFGFGRIVVLQPAVRIGDLHAVIIVHDVCLAREGIIEFSR